MNHLIDDLLELSRLGRHHLRKSIVNLPHVTTQVFQKLQVQHSDRNFQFKVGDMPPCFCDRALLYQVMENLLANAIKFTRTREIATIEVDGTTTGRENIYFVKDNGVGFDEHYTSNLFLPFQRLHSHKDFEGTGVGLAIVKRIVQRHGGRVWAEGKVNEGATFYFALPVDDE